MSTLWTPSGEHIPQKDDTQGAARPRRSPKVQPRGVAPAQADSEEAQEQVEAMRRQLANTPAEVVVSNHCYGLFELAAIYLSQPTPALFQAKLAIDGLGLPAGWPQGPAGRGRARPARCALPAPHRLRQLRRHAEGHRRKGGQPKTRTDQAAADPCAFAAWSARPATTPADEAGPELIR